jgi:hypothetical protein
MAENQTIFGVCGRCWLKNHTDGYQIPFDSLKNFNGMDGRETSRKKIKLNLVQQLYNE